MISSYYLALSNIKSLMFPSCLGTYFLKCAIKSTDPSDGPQTPTMKVELPGGGDILHLGNILKVTCSACVVDRGKIIWEFLDRDNHTLNEDLVQEIIFIQEDNYSKCTTRHHNLAPPEKR